MQRYVKLFRNIVPNFRTITTQPKLISLKSTKYYIAGSGIIGTTVFYNRDLIKNYSTRLLSHPQPESFFNNIDNIINVANNNVKKELYDNGKTKSIRGTDLYCEYNENGHIKFCLYNGIHQTFHNNGNQKIIMNMKTGTYVEYDDTGRKLIDGKIDKLDDTNPYNWLHMHGSFTSYHSDGTIKAKFTRERPVGEFQKWKYSTHNDHKHIQEEIELESYRMLDLPVGMKSTYISKYSYNDQNGNRCILEKCNKNGDIKITVANDRHYDTLYYTYSFNSRDRKIKLTLNEWFYDPSYGNDGVPEKITEYDCNITNFHENKNIPSNMIDVINKAAKLYDYLESFGTLSDEYCKCMNVDMFSFEIKKN